MKKMYAIVCVAMAVALVGCGKKGKDLKKQQTMVKAASVEDKKLAQQDVPIYNYEEDKFFDENQVGDFAFIDDEKNVKKGGKALAENEETPLTVDTTTNSQFKTVNFDLNRNSIRPDQKPLVAQDVAMAKESATDGKNLLVVGHCCQLGSASFNMSLSEQRAMAIKKEMVKAGVPEAKVRVLGAGSECPVVVSDATDREALIKELSPNRRAEVSVS